MSNSNDFDKTKPNIPSAYDDAPSDWEKPNNNFPAQPRDDEWGKTAPNYAIPQDDEPDFDKTYNPRNPKVADWGVTESNIEIPRDDRNEDYGGGSRRGGENYGATTPLIRLPEAERVKYQNLPPTPTEEKAKQEEEKKSKGGTPSWLLVTGGLAAVSLFAVIVLLGIWYFLIYKTGFNVILTSVPQGSRVLIDTLDWGVTTDASQTIILTNLKSGEYKDIEIKNLAYECKKFERIIGVDGVDQTLRANCTPIKVPEVVDPCKGRVFKKGEEALAQSCAEKALANLKEPIDPDELARILSMYIIQFASGKFDIPQKNKDFLQKASVVMKKLPPTTVIEIGGHTDNVGTDESNQKLSENRAKAVRDVLVNEFGVSASTLTEKGYGEAKPKDTNNTEDGKFRNRRIEYTVIKK